MKTKSLLIFLLFVVSCYSTSAQRIASYNIIPKPNAVTLNEGDGFVVNSSIANPSKFAKVSIKKSLANQLGSSEAYIIKVKKNRIDIIGASETGVFYAKETLKQAIGAVEKGETVILPAATITDSPRYSYRGLMLDFSRHFFDKEFVKKQIDAMASYKINRFHLHLTDAGGWRLEIKSHPELTEKTAYRTQENWREWWDKGYDRRYVDTGTPDSYGGYFTQEDMKEIIAYAAERHITIIPEIEMPGHCQDVFYVHPDLCCTGNFLNTGDVCVGNDAVFDFFKDVLEEVTALFPSKYIHIGGDEASKHTWPTCERCQERIKKEGLKDVNGLQSWFIHRIEEMVNGMGKQIIGWDEILEGGLTPGATVMSWRGESGGITAANSGHHVIMTPGNPLYLDMYQDAPPFCPEAQGGYYPLNKVYAYNPAQNFTEEASKLIDGVQGNLWTERVPTPEHAEMMIWPRLLAISEIGWTQPENKDYDTFHANALKEVTRLHSLGYSPFDLKNEVGDRREYVVPVEHLAKGKKVNYLIPYSSSYVAAGETTLTDGLRGNWMYNDSRWQGFIGRNGCVDVVIDLEKATEIHEVYAYFMQMVGPGVFYPGMVEISTSEDGENFTTIKRLTYVTNEAEAHGFRDFGWVGKTKARYIRYKANSGATGGWVFTDEIIVK